MQYYFLNNDDGKKITIPSSQKEINDIEFISYNEFQTNK